MGLPSGSVISAATRTLIPCTQPLLVDKLLWELEHQTYGTSSTNAISFTCSVLVKCSISN